MPQARKIIILCLTRPKMGPARRKLRTPSSSYLYWLVKGLRLLGLKLTTVSEALTSSYGRFACLTVDGLGPATEAAPCLAELGAPATAFVNTRGGAALKLLPPLAKAGWEIGSLGHELIDLTTQGYAEQRRLVSRSRSLIESKTGRAPTLFAYPFGAYDATTVSCVRDEGFKAAVTLRQGVNNGEIEPYHLKRLPLSGKNLLRDFIAIVRTMAKESAPATQTSSPEPREGAPNGAAF